MSPCQGCPRELTDKASTRGGRAKACRLVSRYFIMPHHWLGCCAADNYIGHGNHRLIFTSNSSRVPTYCTTCGWKLDHAKWKCRRGNSFQPISQLCAAAKPGVVFHPVGSLKLNHLCIILHNTSRSGFIRLGLVELRPRYLTSFGCSPFGYGNPPTSWS